MSRAAGGIPAPRIEGAAAAHQQVRQRGTAVAGARRADTERIPAEAEAAVSPPPVPENQPPRPPADDPIPDKTAAVTAASNQRLPRQELPALVRSPQGNMPRLGQRPVPQDDFRLLTGSPATVAAAQLNERDRQRLARYQQELLAAPPVTQQEGAGQPAPLEDRGPPPPVPLPAERRSELTQVLARLLANPRGAAEQMLQLLRETAYPRTALQREYPDIGNAELLGELTTDLTNELQNIREQAGIAREELNNAVRDRQTQLEQEQQRARDNHAAASDAARSVVNEAAQAAMNAIAGAYRQLTQRTEQQAAAAGGETSPQVIELRRDNYLAHLRRTVAEQLGNYTDAAETRERQLTTSEQNYADAYRYAAQQDELRLLQPPRDPNARENQVLAAESRAWADDRTREVRETIRLLKRTATNAAGTLRKNMESAANDARTSIRTWADELISSHRTWWENLWATIQRWRTEANEQAQGWEVSRTRQTTAAVTRDLGFIREVEQLAAQGMDQEAVLASGRLTAEQRAIVEAYFQGGGRDPLGAVAAGLRMRLANLKRPRVNQRLEQLVIAKPYSDWNKLNHIGQAQTGGFNADDIASRVYNAMDQIGTDENAIYTALAGLTPVQSAAVKKRYRAEHGEELESALDSELSGHEMRRAQDLLESNQAAAAAAAIREAVGGWGTDEATIMSVLRNKTPEEREQIRAIYLQRYGESLDQALRGDLNEREQERANALLAGDNARADAVAMDDALRGGWFGGNRKDAEAVFNTVRQEVSAQAAREGWTTAQMEAEITRRNRQIEASYNSRYGDEIRRDEGESALRAAIGQNLDQQYHVSSDGQRYERNRGERDLVLGLLDNDLARVDAARIRIEQEDPNYADDDAINRVLRQQYERSLEEAQRDRGPEMRRARARAMQTEMEAAARAGHPWTPAQQWARQQAIEREVSRTLEREARTTAETRMGNLSTLYQSQYGQNLGTVIEQNMSGDDRKEARVLLQQGGYLSPFQRLDFATRGIGTREDEIREALRGRTRAEIDAINEQWKLTHNGESLESMLRGELSGRDEFDMVDIGLRGAAETADEHMTQMRMRHHYETDESGVFASAAAGPQREWMNARMAELEETARHLNDTNLSAERRSAILDDFEERSDFMDRAIEDHRRAIDSAANTAAMIVGAVVGIAVGILSGGTLGPVVAALLGALASTAATMATKRLIQGSAYGIEEFGFDAAVGIVDALTSIFTAGMGGKLLGQAVRGGTKVIPKSGVTRLVARLGNSPVFRGLNRMDSGLLGRGIQGTGPLARMAASKSLPARVFANVVAEGGESLISAFPSALTGAALDDEVWRGENPVGNILSNTAAQTAQSAGASLLFQGAFRGAAHLRGRMRGPAAHFTETSTALREGWDEFRQGRPDATYMDYVADLEVRRVEAEAEARAQESSRPPAARAADAHPDAPPRAAEGEAPVTRTEQDAAHTATTPDDAAAATPRAAEPTPEAQAAALREGLPPRLRDKVPLEVNPELKGRAVEVHYTKGPNGDITNVRVVAAPGARPIDILMHTPTVQAMRRYSGMFGRARQILDRLRAFLSRNPHLPPGSTAWEAELELRKLPGIIEERMQMLRQGDLDPDTQAQLLADVQNLSRQLDAHQQALDAVLTTPGRGYVAAEGVGPDGKPATGEPARPLTPEEAAARQARLDAARQRLAQRQALALEAEAQATRARQVEKQQRRAAERAKNPPKPKTEDPKAQRRAQRREELEQMRSPTEAQKRARQIQIEEEGRLRQQEIEQKRAKETQRIAEQEAAVQKSSAEGTLTPRLQEIAEHIEMTGDPLSLAMAGEIIGRIRQDTRLPQRIRDLSDADLNALLHVRKTHGVRGEHGLRAHLEQNAQRLGLTQKDIATLMRRLEFHGRRNAAERITNALRAQGAPDPHLGHLEGFILDSVLKQNRVATDEMREIIRKLKPDSILSVARGGNFLTELLAHGDPALSGKVVQTEKRPKGPNFSNQRIHNMQERIIQLIESGQRRFVVVDYYMGGVFAGEVFKMYQEVARMYPNLGDLRFRHVWMRETFGFELGVDRLTTGDFALQTVKGNQKGADARIKQVVVPTRVVLGDDMNTILDPGSPQLPLRIFDRNGRVVSTFEPGRFRDEQGRVLSQREVLIRLIRGELQLRDGSM